MDSMKKENRWELFKKGATSPLTLSMAKVMFTFFVMLGFGAASYTFYIASQKGLSLAMFGLSGLQLIGLYSEWNTFKFLKQQEKDMKENASNFELEMKEKLKELEEV